MNSTKKDCIKIWIIVFCVLYALTCVTHINDAHARWATKEDAAVEYEYMQRSIVIHTDGSYESVTEIQAKIINELGREIMGTMRLQYNKNASNIEILEAQVARDGQEFIVPKAYIERKSLASEQNGFDQLFQIMVSFPNIVVGSTIRLKIKETVYKTAIPNYFAQTLRWNRSNVSWKKSHINVKSAIPLNISVNDPYNKLNVEHGKLGNYQIIDVSLKEAMVEYTVNEDGNVIPDDLFTYISLSSVKNYTELGNMIAKQYEIIANQKLPPAFEKIKNAAQRVNDDTQRFNIVTSMLADSVRYMGDWRTIKGRYLPRNLHVIAATGVGDCKDFAISTVAILRNLGYKANVAIISRGAPYTPLSSRVLPSMNDFNHAIVHVIRKNAEVQWLDPTNFVSMADGMFYDIANRPAVVLFPSSSSYEIVPNIHYLHNIHHQIIEVVYNPDFTTAHKDCIVKLHGESAMNLVGALLILSKQFVEESLVGPEGYNIKSVLPNLKSRIVRNLLLRYSYDEDNYVTRTNYGVSIPISCDILCNITKIRKDQIGDIVLPSPGTYITKTILRNHHATNVETMSYHIKTKWFNLYRQYTNTSKGVEIEVKTEILKDIIKHYEMNTSEFKKVKHLINEKIFQTIIID